jgi:hypothetical protein
MLQGVGVFGVHMVWLDPEKEICLEGMTTALYHAVLTAVIV